VYEKIIVFVPAQNVVVNDESNNVIAPGYRPGFFVALYTNHLKKITKDRIFAKMRSAV
jgi:hypothetical protein